MKRAKVFFLAAGLMVTAAAVVLLLNFTAPNPTGRRYSSQTPLMDGQSTSIGMSAENILSADLRVLRNTASGQRQCLCLPDDKQPPSCLSCVARLEMSLQEGEKFRIPDFVTSAYIAESKNSQKFPYPREISEVRDYISASKLLRRPLFLYVRIDTEVSPEFYQLVESTGGSVVHYFTVPGWVDPVDEAAKVAFCIGAGMFLLGLVMPSRLPRFRREPRQPKPKRADDPLSKAARKIDDMDDFVSRTQDNKRFEIDVEDSRDD